MLTQQALCLMECLTTIESNGVSANKSGELGPAGKEAATHQNSNPSIYVIDGNSLVSTGRRNRRLNRPERLVKHFGRRSPA